MENFQKYLSTAPVLLVLWLTFQIGVFMGHFTHMEGGKKCLE
jgi:hypothetical protein